MPVPLSDFARYVRPEVAGCPDIILLDAILRAGIEFCKKTKIFRETFDLTTVVNQSRYVLATSAGTIADEVLVVQRDQYDKLEPSSFKDFQNNDLDQFDGTPEYYYLDVGNTLVLGEVPNSVETLEVTARTIPTDDATTLPDELATRYKHQIASGAKSILMLMKSQPWTDIANAGIHATLFQTAIDEANLRDAKGAARKPLRTVSQQF